MEQSVIEAVNLGGNVSQDLSMLSLFFRADIVVKGVMIILLFASIWSWAIIFEKVFKLKRLNAKANAFESSFWSGGNLEELYEKVKTNPSDPMSAVFATAMREWRTSHQRNRKRTDVMRESLSERIDRVMQITVTREMDRVERYMTFLASTGSTAPFIGLFGTVWGIMNSFQAIATTKNTSLAVVAPGIAEALFATALGLVAAIPAVVAYNKISRDLDRYAGRLETFAGEFAAILSRQMDETRSFTANEEG